MMKYFHLQGRGTFYLLYYQPVSMTRRTSHLTLFICIQPAIFFLSHQTSTSQPAVLFSHNKLAPATSHSTATRVTVYGKTLRPISATSTSSTSSHYYVFTCEWNVCECTLLFYSLQFWHECTSYVWSIFRFTSTLCVFFALKKSTLCF